jgi:hypothetical protein
MIQLYDVGQGNRVGTISEEQLRRLVDALEEESPTIEATTSPRRRLTCSKPAAPTCSW